MTVPAGWPEALQALLDALPTPIFFKDAAGVYTGCNAAFERFLGLPRARILGGTVFDVAPPDLAEVYRLADEALLRRGGEQVYESQVAWADGSRRDVIFRKAVLPGPAGEPLGIAGTMSDVTPQRRAESGAREALRRAEASEANFRAIVEGTPSIVFIHRDGVVLYANPAAARLVGLPADRLVGRQLLDFAHPDDRAALGPRLGAVGAGGGIVPAAEVRALGAEGRVVPTEFLSIEVQFDGGPARVAIGRDLTERKEAEARLAMAQRLGALGTLAAGVAHELNNPLAFVISNLIHGGEELERLRGAVAEPHSRAALEALAGVLGEAREGADRLRVIVRDLRTLSRADDERRAPVELARVVDYAAGLAASALRQRARLVREFGDVPPLLGNEARLGQLLLNLLLNAAHATPEGPGPERTVRVAARGVAGGRVLLEVSDEGSGMPPEVRARIFEPFFTTKPVGSGTGLGLWVCHQIVEAHGGEIAVDSVEGRGTTVRVWLPAAPAGAAPESGPPATPPAERAAARASTPASARARLLLVDDEPLVRSAVVRLLSGRFDLEEAANAGEALERLAREPMPDAVLCDVMMPGMSGPALRDEISRRRPELAHRFVFFTGGALPGEPGGAAPTGAEWLEKPFDRVRLLDAIERVLVARGGR